jgi:competence protein ComEC
LLWISIALVAGLGLGKYLPWQAAGWLVLAGATLLSWPLLRRLPDYPALLRRLAWAGWTEPRLRLPPLLLLAALFLGAARMASGGPDLASGHVAAFNDQGEFRLQAVVIDPPDRRDSSTLLRLQVESIAPLDEDGQTGPAQPAHGLALAHLPGRPGWQYGDRLLVSSAPETPPENEEFSYRDFLARQDVYTYLAYPRVDLVEHGAGSPILAAIYRLRDWAYAEIYHLFPAPEAPLLAGILLGLDNDLPPALENAFRDTGTAHIIAISGFNFAVLAGLFASLFGRIFSRWVATGVAIFTIAVYAVLVGASPAVVRAAIMSSFALLAQQIGRRSAGMNTLAITSAAMCLANPHAPWDPSFQLSFGATLGLLLYGERFQGGFTRLLEKRMPSPLARRISAPVARKISSLIGEYFLLTLAAQVMTLPVILYHFQRLSVSALLANPLILPPQPLVMVLGGLAVLAGLVSDPLAHAIAALAWPLTAYTIRAVELLARIPGGVVVLGDFNFTTLLLAYGVVLAPLAGRRFPETVRSLFKPALLLIGLGLLAALLWRSVLAAPDGKLRLVVFDAQGRQALLLRGTGGETLLVNGGPSMVQLNDLLGRWLPPFDRRIDAVLVNSPASDAFSGLSGVLERYPPGQVLWSCLAPDTLTGDRLVGFLQEEAIPSYPIRAGEMLAFGREARLELLATTDEGSALLLRWQDFRVLIPGGLPPGRLEAVDLANLSLIVLEPRDLEETTPEQWLAFAPQAVIYTPEEGELGLSGHNWLNTRPGGWVQVTTDGMKMWVEVRKR